MKRVLFAVIIASFLLSGCYLLPESAATPTGTTDIGTIEAATAISTSAATSTPAISAVTVTPLIAPTRTQTLIPTKTSTPTKTALPTKTSTPTLTSTPLPYILQEEAPTYARNFVHSDAGCNWLGLAGQVFGSDGTPQLNLVVVVKGKLGSATLDLAGVTGIPEADAYGPGGYEIQLADKATASNGSLSAQVFDLNGNPLSAAYPFDTYADCEKNLIVINFTANK